MTKNVWPAITDNSFAQLVREANDIIDEVLYDYLSSPGESGDTVVKLAISQQSLSVDNELLDFFNQIIFDSFFAT